MQTCVANPVYSPIVLSRVSPHFAEVLALLPRLSDDALATLPPEWDFLTSLIGTLIEEEGHSSQSAAKVAGVSVALVENYRSLMGY